MLQLGDLPRAIKGCFQQQHYRSFPPYRLHYENRLKLVLGPDCYRAAHDLLTEAAVNDGVLQRGAIDRYSEHFRVWAVADHPVPIDDVLRVLEHDGYLEPRGDEYRFVSGLLEDWWRARHGRSFVAVERRSGSQGA